MRVGIEHEFFIRSVNGSPTRDEIAAFVGEGSGCGCRESDRPGVLLTVGTCIGEAEVKPDAYAHVLEIAFPPADCLSKWSEAFDEAMQLVQRAMGRVGLSIQGEAATFPVVENGLTPFTATPQQEGRLASMLRRRMPARRFAVRHAHAAVCATQFHLDYDAELFLPALPRVYRFQYLVPLGYSNSQSETAHALRPLILRDSFHAPEWLYGFPKSLPRTPEEHNQLLQGTTVGRDYSFVASHRSGTFEFRACDSQPAGMLIAELAALQACISAEALAGGQCSPEAEDLFWASCEDGSVDQTLLSSDLAVLDARSAELPPTLRRWAGAAISRLASSSRSNHLRSTR